MATVVMLRCDHWLMPPSDSSWPMSDRRGEPPQPDDDRRPRVAGSS
jgi:hypothetical protein